MTVSHTASLSSLSTSPTPTVPKDGAPTKALVVQPEADGVSTLRRFFTSSSTLRTRWLFVQVKPASEVLSVGANSTSNARLPAMKSSNLAASRLPAA